MNGDLIEAETLRRTTSTANIRSGVEISYGQSVDALFDSRGSKIHPFWRDSLLQITKPSARTMVSQLNSQQCPMGYDPAASPGIKTPVTTSEAGKKGSLLHYVRQQKEKYSDCIILTRVGEFYETFGTDAILLVEVCMFHGGSVILSYCFSVAKTSDSLIVCTTLRQSALRTECHGRKGSCRLSCSKCPSHIGLSDVQWISSGCL